MNEDNVVNVEQSAETGVSDTEYELFDSEHSEDVMVDGADSLNSDSNSTIMDETGANDVESESSISELVQNDNSDRESGATETIVITTESENYFSYELGGYPVVIVNDLSNGVETVADYYDYYTTLSTTWEDYFAGVLANMGDTEYIAYSLRDYANTSYSSYTDHFILYYDVAVENDELVSGSYPYMDIYRESNNLGYICKEGVGTLSSVPFPAYGSFSNLSDLREGVTHNETWAVLFAIGFAVVYSVCTRFFDCVRNLRK